MLTACGAVGVHADPANGYLPNGITEESKQVEELWMGSWIAALAVGVLVWGLILWCVAAYRKRKDDNTLPVQFQYNVPLEILYTVVPMLMVGVLFYYSEVATQDLHDTSAEPDETINVVAKQWSWDFNYVDDDVHEAGQMAELDGIEARIQDRRAALEAAQTEQRAQLAQVEADRRRRSEAMKGLESRFNDRSAREKALGSDARSLERVLAQLREAARRAEAERRAAAAAERARQAREARDSGTASTPRPAPRPRPQVATAPAPQVGGLGWPVSGSLLTATAAACPMAAAAPAC